MPVTVHDVEMVFEGDESPLISSLRNMDRRLDLLEQQGQRTERRFRGFFTRMSVSTQGLRTSLHATSAAMTALAGVATTALAGNVIVDMIQTADATRQLADRFQATTSFIQEFEFALGQAGTGIADAGDLLGTLVERVGELLRGEPEAGEMFRTLGLSMSDFIGITRDTREVFLTFIEGLRGVEDPVVQFQAAAELLGGEFGRIVNLARLGREGFNRLAAEARATGTVFGSSLFNNATQANRELDRMARILRAELTRLSIELSPHIIALGRSFTRIVAALRGTTTAFGELTRMESGVVSTARAIGSAFQTAGGILQWFMNLSIGLNRILGQLPDTLSDQIRALEDRIAQAERFRNASPIERFISRLLPGQTFQTENDALEQQIRNMQAQLRVLRQIRQEREASAEAASRVPQEVGGPERPVATPPRAPVRDLQLANLQRNLERVDALGRVLRDAGVQADVTQEKIALITEALGQRLANNADLSSTAVQGLQSQLRALVAEQERTAAAQQALNDATSAFEAIVSPDVLNRQVQSIRSYNEALERAGAPSQRLEEEINAISDALASRFNPNLRLTAEQMRENQAIIETLIQRLATLQVEQEAAAAAIEIQDRLRGELDAMRREAETLETQFQTPFQRFRGEAERLADIQRRFGEGSRDPILSTEAYSEALRKLQIDLIRTTTLGQVAFGAVESVFGQMATQIDAVARGTRSAISFLDLFRTTLLNIANTLLQQGVLRLLSNVLSGLAPSFGGPTSSAISSIAGGAFQFGASRVLENVSRSTGPSPSPIAARQPQPQAQPFVVNNIITPNRMEAESEADRRRALREEAQIVVLQEIEQGMGSNTIRTLERYSR